MVPSRESAVALLAATLVVTSTLVPVQTATAATPGRPPMADHSPGHYSPEALHRTADPSDRQKRHDRAGQPSPTLAGENASASADATALETRVRAHRLLADATLDDGPPGRDGGQATRLRRLLNQTFDRFTGLDRVNNSAVFRADRRVAAATAHRAPNVSTLLLATDARLARTAVTDAERALAHLAARNQTIDTAAARAELQHARRALQQADHLRQTRPDDTTGNGNAEGRRGTDRGRDHRRGNEPDTTGQAGPANTPSTAPAAITHYRRAWTHAQHALDLLDRAVDPTVTIQTRADPPHNDTLTYTVQGTILDVRPHTLNVTVLVNGEPRATRVVTNATPATPGRFAATLELTRPVNRIRILVTDPGEAVARQSDDWPAQTTRTTLRLDADGLPDTYERTHTRTDPLDADSDAAATPSDEADDGTPDGAEDFDADGLTTRQERRRGTHPLTADTDGDNLTDAFELFVTHTDPVTPDTDADGTPDGAEDPDADGLPNAREEAVGTDPALADTDADGLDDAAEQHRGTDPLAPDTDGDGLQDGVEPTQPFTTDPLAADTDGDGTPDGNETYTTHAGNQSLGAAVTLTGPGNVARAVTVTNGSTPRVQTGGLQAARASPVVQVQAHRPFENATLTLQYNASQVANETALAIFTYNRTLGIFVPLDSTVDSANDTVTAQPRHFSRFVLMDTHAWADSFQSIPAKWTVNEEFTAIDDWQCAGNCTTTGGVAVVSSAAPAQNDTDDNESDNTTDSPGDGDDDDVSCPDTSTHDGTSSDVNTSDRFDGGGGGGGDPCPGGGGGDGGDDGTDGGGDDGDGDGDGGDVCPDATTTDTDDVNASDRFDGGGGGGACPGGDDGGDGDDTDGGGGGGSGDGNLVATDGLDGGAGGTRPTTSTLSRTIPVPADAHTVRVVLTGRVTTTSENASAVVTVSGDRGTETLLAAGTGSRVSTADATFQTRRVDVADLANGSLTITARTHRAATVQLAALRVLVDTDGDGLWDPWERTHCLPTDRGCTDLNATAVDTDGDTLLDDREVQDRVELTLGGHRIEYFRLLSRPDRRDSDRDAIPDPTELRGWTVRVRETPGGAALRWDPDGTATRRFTSDPLALHSDGDGMSDTVEKRVLHTDPSANVTYAVTRRHQRQMVDRFARAWKRARRQVDESAADVTAAARAVGLLGPGEPGRRLTSLTLDDGSGDFDFVQPDDGGLTFRALDRRPRTDTWLANRREVAANTSVWDPDTDDDGLTDGQELKWVTRALPGDIASISRDPRVSFETSPTAPDTDGDGYWDGWLGVFGAADSRNVILYRAHLHDDDDGDGTSSDDGVQGSETVPAQAGVHTVSPGVLGGSSTSPNSSAMAADVDGDGRKEHSNVHLGELYWATDPTAPAASPTTALTIEVDFHNRSTRGLWSRSNSTGRVRSQWSRRIENNYALYDIRVALEPDAVLNDSDLPEHTLAPVTDLDAPFTMPELLTIARQHHDTSARQYLFVANDSASSLVGTRQTGFNAYLLGNAIDETVPEPYNPQGIFVFAENIIHINATRKTSIHEIGHSFQIGEADDNCLARPLLGGEIYSGETGDIRDGSPEFIGGEREWSVMASGWDQAMAMKPMSGQYFAISIQELTTITDQVTPPCS